MRITKNLNLVIPIDRDDGSQLFLHSTPIASDVFKQYWLLAGQTMNALYTKGVGLFAPRYACEMLHEVAKENAGPDPQRQAQEVDRAERFVAEIRRMTNVFLLGKSGWEMRPLDDAKSASLIDADEAEEIDGALVFFTCGSRSHRKADQEQVNGALSLWGARIESLSCTDFRSSLPTSKEIANSGATAVDSPQMLSTG